mgnify:CR=1 FL=1
MSDWVDVAAVDDFQPGGRRVVDVDDVMIIVFNLDGEYHAIEDVCTHDYASLDDGALEDGCIVCPRHAARFDIRSGEALTAPAYEPIPTFPVRIQDGVVQVRDDRWD